MIVPRCLFFVDEGENPAIIQAGQTVTVNPRRGTYDKEPWRSLDLAAITGQTIERQYVLTCTWEKRWYPTRRSIPLKAILPLKRVALARCLPIENGVGGIRLGGLGRRMRDRWQAVSRLWEKQRQPANKLDLWVSWTTTENCRPNLSGSNRSRRGQAGSCDLHQAGTPTARSSMTIPAIVDYKLFWIACKNEREAYYLARNHQQRDAV